MVQFWTKSVTWSPHALVDFAWIDPLTSFDVIEFSFIGTLGQDGKDGSYGQSGTPGQYGTDGKDGQAGNPGLVGSVFGRSMAI